MTRFEKYDSKIKDLGEYGSNNILYTFGLEYAKELIDRANKSDSYIGLVYSKEAIDKVDEIIFKSHKSNKIIGKILL